MLLVKKREIDGTSEKKAAEAMNPTLALGGLNGPFIFAGCE